MSSWQKARSAAIYLGGVTSLFLCLVFLAVLLIQVVGDGAHRLSWDFLTSFPSRFPDRAGIASALVGTLWVMGVTALLAVPLGVLTGVYLEEYAPQNWFTRVIRLNIHNLAGVPAIVYGMLGLAVFVRWMDLGRSILAGAMTSALMILPIIIIATSEAIKAVPQSIRWGAFGVGASRAQVVWWHVLPSALPGILTGVILALSRAVGEAAPLILVGALSFVAFLPSGPMDAFTVLAIQIFNWAGRPQDEFREIAAAGIIVLLVLTLGMNALAIYFRTRATRVRA